MQLAKPASIATKAVYTNIPTSMLSEYVKFLKQIDVSTIKNLGVKTLGKEVKNI